MLLSTNLWKIFIEKVSASFKRYLENQLCYWSRESTRLVVFQVGFFPGKTFDTAGS